MEEISNYETPLWTLIGVIIGFILSYRYSLIVQRKQYRTRAEEAIERIKKCIHLSNSKEVIKRIADLIPQFRDKEQIRILSEIGLESSQNANMDDVTRCVIEELKWICVLYEHYNLVEKSRKDEKRVKSVQSALWDISHNIIEFRQSENLLDITFNLLNILNIYSITQGYEEVTASSIELYKGTGQLSVGYEYFHSDFQPEYKVLNFTFGIEESINQLISLRQSLQSLEQSSFKDSKISRFLNAIDTAVETIKKERIEKVS